MYTKTQIEAITDAAISAVSKSNPEYPCLLVVEDAESEGFDASMWRKNTIPAAVHSRSPSVVFWGEVPTLDFFDLFITEAEWSETFFREECMDHRVDPDEDFVSAASRLWDALSKNEREEFSQNFWVHYEMSEQVREIVERALKEEAETSGA